MNRQEIANLQGRLDTTFAPFYDLQSRQEFTNASHNFSEATQGFCSLLSKTDISKDPWVWFMVLNSFAECSIHIAKFGKIYQKVSDLQICSAIGLFEKSSLILAKYFESFFRVFQSEAADSAERSNFYNLIKITTKYVIECHGALQSSTLMRSLVVCVSRYLSAIVFTGSNDIKCDTRIEICKLSIDICKACYYGGSPSAILPLVFMQPQCVSEIFIMPVVKGKSLQIETLIDYFRFSAFCLVSCNIELDTIDDQLTRKADVFLKVLLNLPNLQLSNYVLELEKSGDFLMQLSTRYVPVSEREEISFFYILNYLLRLRRLESLAETEKYFKSELRFFNDSFNKRVASELDRLVSVPLSRNGSTTSVPRMAEMFNEDLGVNTTSTLSSILCDGSYKERLRLVVDFFGLLGVDIRVGSLSRLVQTFDMSYLNDQEEPEAQISGFSDVWSVMSRIYSSNYSGKKLYLGAIDKIVRLLQLLSLKFLSTTIGHAQSPREILDKVFHSSYTIDQVLLVKDLLEVKDDKLAVKELEKKSEDQICYHQLRIIERTQMLEHNIQRLI